MIDLGNSSSLNFELAETNIEDLDVIAFTHLHINHSADLPSFV